MDTISTTTEMNWEFVEPLKEGVFNLLEAQLEIDFSDEFKDFIERANYGFNRTRNFMVANKNYTLKHVLDFNVNRTNNDSFLVFMHYLKEWLEPSEIVFANDGYGGYYLLNTETNLVLFLDTDTFKKHVLLNFEMFLKKIELRG
ncbi:SMI1/KNR4 family protein [Helicobacter cetorum]|uniref:SMI1/KNR4 family protein n=1 Tax=Helicobacter cetorum TaxID=138563 RepID=UPI000CF0F28E|nr:SMI1/KNR4 family protein [Helicobacter cetorum]